jgi:hypothetical protein
MTDLTRLTHPVPVPVRTAQELRRQGVSAATARLRCRPGGPWQMPLPGVFLLRAGPLTGEEILHTVLAYTGGRAGEAVISGPAALALRGFAGVPPLTALERVDVLVPRVRRLRSVGRAHIVRTHRLPRPETATGFPVAPVPRALSDTAGRLPDTASVRRLLAEAVLGGHCEPTAVVAELARARLLGVPRVAAALDTLRAAGRGAAESRLWEAVRAGGLPDPCWNVELWLPGGPFVSYADAYWPDRSVAAVIDTPLPDPDDAPDARAERTRRHRTLRGLGITVVRLTARGLAAPPDRRATALRAALTRAAHRPRGSYVIVLPR